MSLNSVKRKALGFQAQYEELLHSMANNIRLTRYPLIRACIGEFFGTMILVIFGLGVGAQARFAENHSYFSISFGWGLAALFGLLVSGTMGYGLINPAMALAGAIVGKVPWIYVLPLMILQVFGAYVGALTVYGVYMENIRLAYNGSLTMDQSGLIFCTGPAVGSIPGLIDQIVGTALLAALCYAFSDVNNFNVPGYVQPFYFGFLISALIGAYGVNAGGALNPARDLGPRLALLTVGYGFDAFTHGNYYFWVPIVGPLIGACVGAILYELTIGIHLRGVAEQRELDDMSNDPYLSFMKQLN